jgi:hypothetical protein
MATVPVATDGTASEVAGGQAQQATVRDAAEATQGEAPEVTHSNKPEITTESKEPETTHGGTAEATNGTIEIPKTCKAGVVVNEGPDFKLEVEDVPVPEPGKSRSFRDLT